MENFETKNCDFSGWATRNDLLCSDGRVIRHNAFADQDGEIVPLVWNHQHNDVKDVLGHALLQNRDEGVYTYGFFNDTESGKTARMLVDNGDITALSIYANKLKQDGPNVMHGCIREVSLVHCGANPGAFIDFSIAHSDDSEEEAVIYTGLDFELSHSEDAGNVEDLKTNSKEVKTEKMAEKENRTVQDIVDTMNEEQKNALYFLVGNALENAENGEENEENNEDEMNHNAFDQYENADPLFTYADEQSIIHSAMNTTVGTLQNAIGMFAEEAYGDIAHADIVTGAIEELTPEYYDIQTGAPEYIFTHEADWAEELVGDVHKAPFSRLRTTQASIDNYERTVMGKGYVKGTQKKEREGFNFIRRTTDPQTVYTKSKLNRDDIVDITDFDVVNYMYQIDKQLLTQTIGRAILFGDGLEDSNESKIHEDKIRPIWGDNTYYTKYYDFKTYLDKMNDTLAGDATGSATTFGENFKRTEALVHLMLDAKLKFKGSGTPTMYAAPTFVNQMLLARDLNGRRLYSTKAELATALGVKRIVEVEDFTSRADELAKDVTVESVVGNTTTAKTDAKPLAIVVNPDDYTVGSTKGGEVTHFTDFDIDFNQEKSLIETRLSGANTKLFSAFAIVE